MYGTFHNGLLFFLLREGQMIFPKNGGSVDAIDHFWGECSSKVIFLGGVEIKLVDFGGSVVPFHKKLGGGNIFHLKSSRMGGGRHLFQKKWGEVGASPKKLGI